MSSSDKRSPKEQAAELIADIFIPLGDDPGEAAANFAEGMSRYREGGNARAKAKQEILRILRERYGIEEAKSPDRHTYAGAMYAGLGVIACIFVFFAWVAVRQISG
jgi:hypothetical protein